MEIKIKNDIKTKYLNLFFYLFIIIYYFILYFRENKK